MSTLLDALRQLEARGPVRTEAPGDRAQTEVAKPQAAVEPVAVVPAKPQAVEVAKPQAVVSAGPEAVVTAKPRAARCAAASRLERQVAEAILAECRDDGPGVLAFLPAGPSASVVPLLERLGAALAACVGGEVLVLDAAGDCGRGAAVGSGRSDSLRGVAVFRAVADGRSGAERLAPPDQVERPGPLESLRRQYPWVLVAGGPADESASAELARCCDGVYLLVELAAATRRGVVEAAESVRSASGRLLGCLAVGPTERARASGRGRAGNC